LQRKLKSSLVRNGKLLPFLTEKPMGRDILDTMLHDIQMGTNIVLEFGSQQSSLVYLLVANVLTRRLHAHYVKEYEAWVGRGMKKSDEPKKLMITIEEAHKFLNPQAARQTIFGTIAREMRKYWVTLLIVDQRPSGIDDEILSQIGTRITAQLNDEADINAVLTGVNGATGLKGVLAQLDSKQQALVLGHSVPMPVMIQTRRYDNSLWSTLGAGDLDDPDVRATKLRQLDDF
jgi:DNA helicase HerA-like ATPase